ncbi:MAG: gsiA 1 [Rhizobacter sp.]|nr:gsiA 1 [Rhizobacter sp.]
MHGGTGSPAPSAAPNAGPFGAMALRIDHLSVALPPGADRAFAIEDISLAVAAGETVCVVGESGSGKSVLSMAVMGLLAPELRVSQGRIELGGETLLDAIPERLRALRGKSVSMVFQEPMTALNPIMTCGRQIDELLVEHTDWNAAERRVKILDMLVRVRLPEPQRILKSYPHQLSGGQRQRIVIAMAVILGPTLIICDEPTTALDVTTQKEILKLIGELQAGSVDQPASAVLFITHDIGVVAEIADHVDVMHLGQVVEAGTRDEVLLAPKQAYTRQLLASVPSLVPPMQRIAAAGPVILHGSNVVKNYTQRDWLGRSRHTAALHGADLALRGGETIGVIGESGSGKSTLARCLVRLIEPSAGSIRWNDDEVATLGEAQLRRLRGTVQIVFQDPNRSLNPRLRVGDSLIEGAVNFGASRGEAIERAALLMDKVKLSRDGLARYPSQFSGGQRQRLAIARALACQPRVLVADEAVSALDVTVQAQIVELLKELRDELGLGLLFITHDLRVAAQLCDRVMVMHRGRVVEEGLTAEVYADPQHAYTRGLLRAAPGATAMNITSEKT